MVKEVVIAAPRGFCAGVARSIKAVEETLRIYGAPVYIKHAIVHNTTVVHDLEQKGAVTVESVDEIPDGAVAVFSAHGSPPEHYEQAEKKGIRVIDATCPLVTKVHMEMRKFVTDGFRVIYIGHKGHVEGLGVIGEAQRLGVDVPVVEVLEDIDLLVYGHDEKIALLTQTTLNCDETKELITAVKKRYPHVIEPASQDICYATTNRQNAVRALSQDVDVVIIVGSQTSSNSKRLRETAMQEKCPAYLVDSVEEIEQAWYINAASVGVSAGASAPEHKVQEIIAYFEAIGAKRREMIVTQEHVMFTEPVALTRART